MTPYGLFNAVLITSLINGLVSPLLVFVAALAPIWLPEFMPRVPEVIFYGASMVIAFGTLLLSGIPAALYERLTGQRESDQTSMLIWLAGAAFLTVPAVTTAFGIG